MAEIRLWNTKTKRKDPLEPTVSPGKVSMYVCGPTVYDRAHIGNARPVIVFDVLFRLLRHVYGAGNVTYVRNFTDVDDKIIRRSEESGEPIDAITEKTIAWYHQDMDALGVLRPTHEPRATAYIGQMIAMIEGLVAGGFAYAAEGHVLFAVEKFAEYGALSGRSVDDMIAGARVEVAPYKRNPMDFVLWKPSSGGQPGWESPWGHGRPGWHIECSAMSHAILGESFDIHGGGNDLMFPHHENEIAQSRCAHPGSDFARVWMHNEMLQVEGKKMSKSLGNFFTVHDVLEQGIPGEVIRFVYLSTHYRKPMDWTARKAEDAKKKLARWFQKTDGVEASTTVPAEVEAALEDDLNTHLALSKLDKLSAPSLKASMRLLGFPDAEEVDWFRGDSPMIVGVSASASANLSAFQMALQPVLEKWQAMRDAKNYAAADDLKAGLLDIGVSVRATGDGPQASVDEPGRFDPKKLESFL